MKRIACLLLLFVVTPLYANAFTSGWLATVISEPTDKLSLQQLQQSADLYDCGLEEENQSFCSDTIRYYSTAVVARFDVEQGWVDKIELSCPFSNQAYTQLQLNLRKDGYVLVKVSVEDKEYDVIEQLKHKTMNQVNRDVVMFINASALVSHKVMHWQKKVEDKQQETLQVAVFESHSEGIAITIK
ncbi:hypothetical protein [Vibrio sp. 99-8-1]|uniref:hypothetical protein n=1 Tax=Vibrio sp. 99-8-1 TaxID=2607602 RepID=UPI001493B4D4|nr:hypothetical protein [Vibrio sp. 99-8-1]NOI65205.1 hypothetical protein [Vibrio sp. 99-8-1]